MQQRIKCYDKKSDLAQSQRVQIGRVLPFRLRFVISALLFGGLVFDSASLLLARIGLLNRLPERPEGPTNVVLFGLFCSNWATFYFKHSVALFKVYPTIRRSFFSRRSLKSHFLGHCLKQSLVRSLGNAKAKGNKCKRLEIETEKKRHQRERSNEASSLNGGSPKCLISNSLIGLSLTSCTELSGQADLRFY